jgi:S1-C subfamily serine protease
VLRVKDGRERFTAIDLGNSDELQVGDVVLAVGNPFGVGQTVTHGIVSALARTQVGITDYQFFIQTDAAINPGNSGGALVTMDGKLAGINSAIYSRSGGSIGIGFAIPSNMVAAFLAAEQHGGKLERPWIGANGQGVSSEMAEAVGLSHPTGVMVNQIYPGGPAESAGLKRGDIITAINGKPVDDPGSLRFRLATLPIGGQATLDVVRDRQPLQLRVSLVAPPENPPAQKTLLTGEQPLAGATVANLSPALAEQLQIETDWRGVIIVQIRRGSPADRLGLQEGDLILKVNERRTASVGELEAALRAADGRWVVTFSRDGQTQTLQIE